MTIRISTLAFIFIVVLNSCTKEVKGFDLIIEPAFIDFPLADIDTFVIRKFKPANNYQNLIDTFVVQYDKSYSTPINYHMSNDTTIVHNQKYGIVAGFDWQIFIPSLNKTIAISDIVSNKKTITCGAHAVGANCSCANDLLSAKKDNETITFLDVNSASPYIYIRN